ncbi:MAG: hydroxyacid dehydrogenase [Bacteroidales bacterium]|nr:hydroxyacid dehydrogenase [Bacteroidales bacterium]
MKIVTVEPLGISNAQFEQLQKEFKEQGHEFVFFTDRNENPDELARRIGDADIVVISNIKLSAETMGRCPNLKMLSVAFTGLDHIDLDYCTNHNITVMNASGYSTVAVSELAIGLMLDVYRKISHFDSQIRNGGTRANYLGLELGGKTVGVVGTGAIGTQTIRLLMAFGCNVLAYSRTERQNVKDLGVTYVSLDELMKNSDIITLHVPLNKETYHLIGKYELSLMKPSAILINTARGNVVDIPELANMLKDGTLAGAGIDVFEMEPPLPHDHPLCDAPNCVLVPHIGYATREAFDIRADIVMENIRQWLKKQ